jgi:DNA polymerase
MQGEAETQVRAWVEYFRDLGVNDLYRRGEPAPQAASEAEAVTATPDAAVENGVPFALEGPSAPPIAETISVTPDRLISFNELAPVPSSAIPAAEREAVLRAIQDEIGDCTRCPLAYAGRHKIVFGDGPATARLMFVGEGPGADEDAQGLPFVGKAGQLLNNMIGAMGLARAEVYIANIVKCRPPGNRVPEPAEANICSQFLLRQIDVLRPEAIVALGATAATYLLGVKQSLSSLRGRWHRCRGAKLAVTYHPAFLLRDPRQKAEAWKDLQMVMRELGLTPPASRTKT